MTIANSGDLQVTTDLSGTRQQSIPVTVTNTTQPVRVVGAGQTAFPATIAASTSLSGAIDLGDLRAVRIAWSDAWTAAVATFQTSYDGLAWNDLYDETGIEVSYQPVAGKALRLPLADWLGVRYLKVRSGTTGTPIDQGADRVLTIIAQG